MKKIGLIRMLMILAYMMISSTAFSKGVTERFERFLTEPASYVCYRTTGKINIDGELNETDWENAISTEPFVDISGAGFAKPKYSTRAKMLWDDNYLFVAAVLEDDNIVAKLSKRDTIIYYDNDFEVFIDPDGDGHNYFEIENNARGVIFDLMLDKPYRNGGNFMIQWDCPGLRLAVHNNGTINNQEDKDKSWVVEMAIPREAITLNFNNPLKAGKCWRVNFSRVQWLKKGGPEENWVWTPTGRVDMHMPDRWGYLYFSDKSVAQKGDKIVYPYNRNVYKLLWAMFYAQQQYHSKSGRYYRSEKEFIFSDIDRSLLPKGSKIIVEATNSSYLLSISSEGKLYTLSDEGKFNYKDDIRRIVKNWVWTGLDAKKSIGQWKEWFDLLKECGISAVLFEGYDEDIYKLCKESGLEAHHWKWTMNRKDLLESHSNWYAVNRLGESCFDKPAYVNYYRFLCPNQSGLATFLANDYVKEAKRPYVDGLHLDYVRMPDVILPVGLWDNYKIEQTYELPEYDYCYCDVCRSKFKNQTGIDPLMIKYPMENQSWINFRLNSITNIVDSISNAVKTEGKFISAAVFPGPSMAKKMVRQDWGNWSLDAYFPMIYNKFYLEGVDWIGESVRESVTTLNGKASIYAGLMFSDIKDDFEKALDLAFDNGADGVSFFGGPDKEYLYRLKNYLEEKGYKK